MFIMHPTATGATGEHSGQTSKSKIPCEPVAQGPACPDSCCHSKKSKVQEPLGLKRHKQTAVYEKIASHHEHTSKSCKMTSSMQSASKDVAKSPDQDSYLYSEGPAGTAATRDENSEEDLYRAEEEIEQERQEKQQSNTAFNVEDQGSIAPPQPLLSYSQKEWKGNTSKSRLIKRGYEEIALTFESLCRVRGDNYCALRATLFQLLKQSTELPIWLHDSEFEKWPSSVQDLVDQWRFPFKNEDTEKAVKRLTQCLMLLKNKWQQAVNCPSPAERDILCQQAFVGGCEEYELLEALKFLMLKKAIQLHSDMQKGLKVPEFCWLLFARDTSKCPKSFLTNHLKHVGFTGGLEQVEMFLLGYSLNQTLQVYRLYKTDTEEFVTYYPDDHKSDWPLLSLVTEDDRHYNVPVPKQTKPQSSRANRLGGPKWKKPSGGSEDQKKMYR